MNLYVQNYYNYHPLQIRVCNIIPSYSKCNKGNHKSQKTTYATLGAFHLDIHAIISEAVLFHKKQI